MDCLRLELSDLRNSGIITGTAEEVLFSWSTGPAEDNVANVKARVVSRGDNHIAICLGYVVHLDGKAHEVEELIHVVKAGPDEAGQWWFQCPAKKDGKPCGSRAGVLYLPPNQQYFACRRCHDLTYPRNQGKKDMEGMGMNEMSDSQNHDDGQGVLDNKGPVGADSAGAALGEAPADGPDREPGPCTLRLRSFAYVDHALKQLDPQNTTVSEVGRMKLVDELLVKMVGDDGLPEERFTQAIPQVQLKAPAAFGAFATRVLREGNFSVGSDHGQAYYPFHRLGKILRLHLVHDLQLERAGDLLLLDAAVEALIQARILLGRATGLSTDNGPLPGEERLYRSQAVQQQKLFMAAMDKLTPKQVRRIGRPPAKESA